MEELLEFPSDKGTMRCEYCDGYIYTEDYYYKIDGDIMCEECGVGYIKDHFRKVAQYG